MKLKLISILLFCMSLGINRGHADCSISTNINASNWSSSSYSSCTGIIRIAEGVTLTMNADLTLPGSVTELIIESGGRIQFQGGRKLYLHENTVLNIENKTITDPQNPAAAIYAPNPGGGACNNNTAIYIGSVKYSACTGGGNVCLIFSELVAQGGSMRIEIESITDGIDLENNTLCTSNATENTITYHANITNSSQLVNEPTYSWTIVSYPVGTSIPVIANPNDSITDITTFAPGEYIISLQVNQNLSTEGCTTALNQSKSIEVPLIISLNPVATITGDQTLIANSSPSSSAVVTMGGLDASKEYSIWYTLNDIPYGPVTTTGGAFNTVINDTEAIGEYIFNITKIYDGVCEINPVDITSKVTIISEPLSVFLIKFDGTITDCLTKINSKFSSTDNIKIIQLEKSIDGKNFAFLSQAIPQNNSLSFDFIDQNVNLGNNIYRLKIIDKSGLNTYSQVINLNSNCQSSNKTHCFIDENNILKINNLSKDSKIIISSIEGKTLLQLTTQMPEISIPFENNPSGVYIISIIANGREIQHLKVIK